MASGGNSVSHLSAGLVMKRESSGYSAAGLNRAALARDRALRADLARREELDEARERIGPTIVPSLACTR